MDMSKELIAELSGRRERRSRFGNGIRLASDYVAGMIECADDELCRRIVLSDGAVGLDRSEVMKQAAGTLTYANEDMIHEKHVSSVPEIEEFCKQIDVKVPPRTIMVFENVVTTPRKDRDGDILRTDGALVDPAMPLLWHHMPPMPIGKMLKVLKHDKRILKVATAVIDSSLGLDAAALVEFGALRISHGFRPLSYKRMDDEEDGNYGFEIMEFEIMEESVVSVPSNVDAVITQFSRGKLHDPLVKHWAKRISDSRPLIVKQSLPEEDECCDEEPEKEPEVLETQEPETDEKAAVPYENTPASESNAWDGAAAVGRLRAWAGGPDIEDIDWDKYRRGFAFIRGDKESFGSYILPHHDVEDGKLVVNRGGASAVIAALNGARGGVELPDSDRTAVYNHVKRHYSDVWPDADVPELREAEEDEEEEEKHVQAVESVDVRLDTGGGITAVAEKDGRVLSKRNMDKLQKASDLVQEVLESARQDSGDEDKQNTLQSTTVALVEFMGNGATVEELKALRALVGNAIETRERASGMSGVLSRFAKR